MNKAHIEGLYYYTTDSHQKRHILEQKKYWKGCKIKRSQVGFTQALPTNSLRLCKKKTKGTKLSHDENQSYDLPTLLFYRLS